MYYSPSRKDAIIILSGESIKFDTKFCVKWATNNYKSLSKKILTFLFVIKISTVTSMMF